MSAFRSWHEEKQSEYLYRVMAHAESHPNAKKLFESLAKAAAKQADMWVTIAANNGEKLEAHFLPDQRTRFVAWLVIRLGPRRMKQILAAMKVRGLSIYASLPLTHSMPSSIDEVGKRHRGLGTQGNLRAAIFGVNDGLVSNVSLILGVAGASPTGDGVLVAGVAGLLAGAFSMATGEYVSVRAQKEMFEYQIGLEREELATYPEEEAEELALIYEAKGLTPEAARSLANSLIADPNVALDTLAREELGLNPGELGSPIGAALSSFLSFGLGAAVPLIPLIFVKGSLPLIPIITASALMLLIVGASVSLFSGRNAVIGGLRMLTLGAAAGAATFFLGKLLGVSLS